MKHIKHGMLSVSVLAAFLTYSPNSQATTFAQLACSVLPDASARTQCENYATTYVTDLSVSSLTGLISQELSDVTQTLDLMGLSKLSTIPNLGSMSLTEFMNSTILNATGSDMSAKLTEYVTSKYSSSFLEGLTDSELTSLYESEFNNLKTLMDFSGVGGSNASSSNIAIEHDAVCMDPELNIEISCTDVDEFGNIIDIEPTTPAYTQYITTSDLDFDTSIANNSVSHTTSSSTYQADKETIDSIEITAKTIDASLSCMSWQWRGICVWLKWSFTGPKVKTSIKVENFVPELTFQTYDDGDKPPWNEARALMTLSGTDNNGFVTRGITSLMGATGAYKNTGGGKNGTSGARSRSKTKFKMVDAFGNPAQLVFEHTYGHLEAFCTPTTDMLKPYYNSNLDATNWRQHFGSEFLDVRSWIPGTYMLGSYGENNHYGSIFPRIGFATTADEIKASVLTTFRAAHFITRQSQLHVYQSIYRPHKKGLWVSNELEQDDARTGKFQQLLPYKESKCQTFPLERNPDGKRRGETGSTVWNFWRKVTCCKKRGSTLLFHT